MVRLRINLCPKLLIYASLALSEVPPHITGEQKVMRNPPHRISILYLSWCYPVCLGELRHIDNDREDGTKPTTLQRTVQQSNRMLANNHLHLPTYFTQMSISSNTSICLPRT
ncbi:hypothetical protein BU16DRAFT_380654 [Lophium mytilinum]|uniref:Secreted protein n=1 Tax=Lophium mytilinum TaxID=390894 RepID=A0A6A6QSM2_9PEZI|nr:hypothetical protein BU16DRAFT_380654 [Lophium mytilinum]